MDAVPEPHFNVWLPALETGVLQLRDLIKWADLEIMRLPTPPRWLLELSLATDDEGVRRAWEMVPEGRASGPFDNTDPRQFHLGLLYLEYEAGRLALEELLSNAGYEADPSSAGIPEPEEFYLLLNELNGGRGGPTRPSEGPLEDRVRDLFAPLAEKARAAFPHIHAVRRTG
jgi:hypothetical protein